MPGTKGSRDKTGLFTMTVPFYVEELTQVTQVGRTSPLGLKETNREFEDIEGAGFEVSVTYEGFEDGIDEGEIEYDFDPSFSEEPIESHPLINELIEHYEGQVDSKSKKVTFGSTLASRGGGTSKKGKTRKNPLSGLSTYVSLRSVFRMTYTKRSLPASLFKDIGTIKDSLPGGFPTPSGRDWLVMPPKVSERGNAFQITEEWMASPPGGWPKSIYKLIEQ